MMLDDKNFYPRTVLSGTGFASGITVSRVRLGPGRSPGLVLEPCGRSGVCSPGGRMLWHERAAALRDAIQEALAC